MELTPQLLTDEIDFRIAVRGYDRNEVDDFLERVAVAVGQLQSQLTKAATRARNAEKRLMELESAPDRTGEDGGGRDESAPVGAEPAEPAEVVEPVAAPKAPPAAPETLISDDEALNDELRRTLVLAQRTADTAIREAHDQARAILDQANEDARSAKEATEAETARTREEARRRLIEEIAELEALRETMRRDTVVLERHLGSERTRVRETIQVLRRLVDDPESFRTSDVPELSEARTPSISPAPEATPAARPEESAPAALPKRGEDRGESEPEPGGIGTASDEQPDEPDGHVEADRVAPSTSDEAPATELRAEEPVQAPEVIAEEPPDGPGEAAPEPDAGSGPVEGGKAQSSARTGAATSDSEQLGQLFDATDTTRDWRGERPDRQDQGPHTQPVAAARFEQESDEAFLAELRRAMDDGEPLGPGED